MGRIVIRVDGNDEKVVRKLRDCLKESDVLIIPQGEQFKIFVIADDFTVTKLE